MKTLTVSLLFLLATVGSGTAQEHRVLEISSRVGPMICELIFYDESGGEVGTPIPIRRKQFFWRAAPPGAAQFALKTATVTSKRSPLAVDGHTYVRLKKFPDPKRQRITGFELEVTDRNPTPVGEVGWVYLGELRNAEADSEWSSLFLVDKEGKSPDRSRYLTYEGFVKDLTKLDSELKNLLVNFPLYLRDQPGERDGAAPIVRPGQAVEIDRLSSLRPDGKIYAKVTVK